MAKSNPLQTGFSFVERKNVLTGSVITLRLVVSLAFLKTEYDSLLESALSLSFNSTLRNERDERIFTTVTTSHIKALTH
jgi:hypothetical protein